MDNWISNLAIKALHICRLNKEAAGNHRQDMTRPILEDLINDGYQVVQWNSNGSHHSTCRDLNRQQWDIHDFISGLSHDAPMFEKSHPGCSSCSVTVSGDSLPAIELDSFGDMDAAIGTSRPLKVPVEPKIKQKVLTPIPKPKIMEKPVVPETKIKYIPKEVHKQIKDPFEKRDLSPQEYEDWLRDLEKENVEESIPLQPTEQEREDWLKDLERETSLRIPQWIKGIIK